jgi:hypothetical protein
MGTFKINGYVYVERRGFVMAKPIDLILTLENDDAKRFWENMENPPEPTEEELQFCIEAIKLYNEHPFLKL